MNFNIYIIEILHLKGEKSRPTYREITIELFWKKISLYFIGTCSIGAQWVSHNSSQLSHYLLKNDLFNSTTNRQLFGFGRNAKEIKKLHLEELESKFCRNKT